jgi:hypothetical protein
MEGEDAEHGTTGPTSTTADRDSMPPGGSAAARRSLLNRRPLARADDLG